MRTIYLRNVPDEVADHLQRLAERAGMSLNAFAVRELAHIARRLDDEATLDALPDLGIPTAEIPDALDEARASR